MAQSFPRRVAAVVFLAALSGALLAACGASGAGEKKLVVAGDLDPSCASSKSGDGLLRGAVYNIPTTTGRIPDFDALTPVASVCTTKLDALARPNFQGFPGVKERLEWFAIDYRGTFKVDVPGDYKFRLTSDDGSALYIDGNSLINMDGLHGASQQEVPINLTEGPHKIRVSYFQGAGDTALILEAALATEPYEIFHLDRALGPNVELLPVATVVDGAKFTSGVGCATKQGTTENKLKCGGSGCGGLCAVGSSLNYTFKTEPDKRYTATFKIADYMHNCADTLALSFFANGDRVTSWRGTGVDGWVPVSFDFAAAGKATTVRITEDNDACCRCSNSCSPACQPLYGDLNVYVESVIITEIK